MPTAANITVKKADGTTDILWSVVAASGGDKSPAVFRSLTTSGSNGMHPELRVSSAQTASNTGRKVQYQMTFPHVYTDSTTGLVKVDTRANMQATIFVPADMPDTDLAEFAAQMGNLLASSLIKSVNSSGFAPM